MNSVKKIAYVSGPVDGRKIFDSWQSQGPTELFGTSYVRHFMQYCEDHKIDAVIVTSHGDEEYCTHLGRFHIINVPQKNSASIFFHFDSFIWLFLRLRTLHKLNCEVVILTAAQYSWYGTIFFRPLGMRFINSYHCALRSLGHKLTSLNEIFIKLTSHLHLRFADPTMVIAPPIIDELAKEPGAKRRKVFHIYPDYDRELFVEFEPPKIARGRQSSIHVLFAGRVERNKGVFDIIEICRLTNLSGDGNFHFHIHGTGTDSEELHDAVLQSGLADFIHIYGFTGGNDLLDHYRSADIVIVPTRSDFEEGLAKSVVEGVLSLRPTVTSKACPSIHMLKDACVEAIVDDPVSYASCIVDLARRPEYSEEKSRNARHLREMFFGTMNDYYACLKDAMDTSRSRTRRPKRATVTDS